MKSANDHWNVSLQKVISKIHSMRKLVGLHTNESDQAMSRLLKGLNDRLDWEDRIGFIVWLNDQLYIFTKHATLGAIQDQAIEGS
jgi:acetone carboxylase gamma subunit